MEERKGLSEYTQNVLKVVVILLFFLGATIFGNQVWAIDFKDTWKRWVAIVVGEISFLYTFVFVVAGIIVIVVYFKDRKDNNWGLRGGLVCLCLAAIFQIVFWGVVLSYSEVFKIAGLLAAVAIGLAWWLRSSCLKE